MTRDYNHRAGTDPTDEWLTTEALAAELGVSVACVTDWIRDGRDIPHFQLGLGPHTIRFRRSDVAPLIKQRLGDQSADTDD